MDRETHTGNEFQEEMIEAKPITFQDRIIKLEKEIEMEMNPITGQKSYKNLFELAGQLIALYDSELKTVNNDNMNVKRVLSSIQATLTEKLNTIKVLQFANQNYAEENERLTKLVDELTVDISRANENFKLARLENENKNPKLQMINQMLKWLDDKEVDVAVEWFGDKLTVSVLKVENLPF